MRFVLILLGLALAVMAGLFVYGQMLEVETTTITQEVENGAS